MNLPDAVTAEFRKDQQAIKACVSQEITLEQPEEGRYQVMLGETEIARFRLRKSLQCSGIAVPYRVLIQPAYRGRGLGQLLERMRLRAAKAAGFGLALMTTRADNEVQRHIAQKTGWEQVRTFHNNVTDHECILWLHRLEGLTDAAGPA